MSLKAHEDRLAELKGFGGELTDAQKEEMRLIEDYLASQKEAPKVEETKVETPKADKKSKKA